MTKRAICYLLHFDRKYFHAGHYLGSTKDLYARLAEHATGRGARLMEVIHAAGIGFQLVRTWEGGRTQERRLKAQHAPYRLCPVCCADRHRQRRPRERRS